MIDILRAEWQKVIGNRWTTGLLIWIFPVGALAMVGFMSLFALFSPGYRNNVTPLFWTDNFMTPWSFANNFVWAHIFVGVYGRYLCGRISMGHLEKHRASATA